MALPRRIEGETVVLRRWGVSDAERLGTAVAENAEHLRPWLPWMAGEPQSLAARRGLLAQWEQAWEEGGDAQFGIFVGEGVGGSCGLLRRGPPDTLEIGYWVHRTLLRRGVASEAARLLTDAAFALAGVEAVEIHHDRANLASEGVPRRLGFALVADTPAVPRAPADSGVDRVWRAERDAWRR